MFYNLLYTFANYLVFALGLSFMTTAITFPIKHSVGIYLEETQHIPLEYVIISVLSAIFFIIGWWMINKTKDFCIRLLNF